MPFYKIGLWGYAAEENVRLLYSRGRRFMHVNGVRYRLLF